jgi:hypothetical protein
MNTADKPCDHCGLLHKTTCPRIKAIEYKDGEIVRIEFHDPAPIDNRIWQESIER